MKQKTLSILLAVLMSMVASAATSKNGYDAKIDNIYYYLRGNGAIVTYGSYSSYYPSSGGAAIDYSHSDYSGIVNIPETVTYNGKEYTVVDIGAYAFIKTTVTRIVIPSTIQRIEDTAFYGCTAEEVYCYSVDVPSASINMGKVPNYNQGYNKGKVIENIYKATLYVPKESVEKYKHSYPWCFFSNICALPDPVESLTIERKSMLLPLGETKALGFEIQPAFATNKNVEWSSSDESVATVDGEGNVTAVKVGQCNIIVTSEDNPNASDTCAVTVILPVTGFTLNYNEYTLNGVGASFDILANVEPENASIKDITWESSDKAICTVSNTGKVVAVGEGEAIITAKTVDGGYTATCKVTVLVNHPATGVVLNYDAYTLGGIGKSVQLTATVSPSNANNKEVTWKSYNESVCVVSNGLVVAVGYGTAMVSVSTVDGNHMAFCTITVADGTAVSEIKAEDSGYKVFDLQGMEYPSLRQGLNIIRFSDGTTKKVMIK